MKSFIILRPGARKKQTNRKLSDKNKMILYQSFYNFHSLKMQSNSKGPAIVGEQTYPSRQP